MEILLAWYKNIGPFTDELVVRFDGGATLVKAPIGTGKSFLYFDAPLWALYKSNQRPLLHRNAKEWSIRLLFERDQKVYEIRRDIVATKAWNDSIRSRFFVYSITKEQLLGRIQKKFPQHITVWGNLQNLIVGSESEEIECVSQQELEQLLRDLLPAKEVAMNVYFLMQDQQSVFDMAPWERITVFKELFNLIWIDQGKEILQEKKRELQVQIKELTTTERMDHKSKIINDSLRALHKELDEIMNKINREQIPEAWAAYQAWIKRKKTRCYQDLELLWDNARGNEKTLSCEDLEPLHQTAQTIAFAREETIKEAVRLEEITQKVKQIHHAIEQKKHEIHEEETMLASLQLEYQAVKMLDKQIQTLDEELADCQIREDALVADIDWTIVLKNNWPQDGFLEYYTWILQQKLDAQELHRKKMRWQEMSAKREERKQWLVKQIQLLQEQQAEVQREIERQQQFHCEKIQGNCPYVDIIKWWSVRSLMRQSEHITKQIQQLKNDGRDEKKQIDDELHLYLNEHIEESLQQYQELFKSLPRKDIPERHAIYTQLQATRRSLQEQKRNWEEKKQTSNEIHTKIIQLQNNTQRSKELYENLLEEEIKVKAEYDKRYQLVHKAHTELYAQWWELIQKILTTYSQLQDLMEEYTYKKYRLKQMQEEERICSALLTIFSKELLLVVLQEFLPTLEDVINNHLAQLVDWKLLFELKETTKVELEIWIDDKKWKRQVKSLSGWQKTILKLVRIMSVATMLQTKFLYMDETINNIDEDTIARVATFLEEYIKRRDLSCIVVTHAPQIQHMPIWDRTIDLSEIFW
jgi:DNA repair exonuclease SbcCD ATPase subunit